MCVLMPLCDLIFLWNQFSGLEIKQREESEEHCLGKGWNWPGRIWKQRHVKNVKIIGYYLHSTGSALLSIFNGCLILYRLCGKGAL